MDSGVKCAVFGCRAPKYDASVGWQLCLRHFKTWIVSYEAKRTGFVDVTSRITQDQRMAQFMDFVRRIDAEERNACGETYVRTIDAEGSREPEKER